MRTLNVSRLPKSVWLGRKSERNFRPWAIAWDDWLREFPGATLAVVYVRPDKEKLVVATSDKSPVIWTPTLDVTTVSGIGTLEMHLVGEIETGISASVETVIDDSAADAETPATPSWVEQVVEATGHYPKIQNGTWWVWDVNGADWVDTGVAAQGAQGIPGQDGADGSPGTPGADGADGVSPVVTVEAITGGHRVTITDAEHPQGQSFDVMDGQGGGTGLTDDVKQALLACFRNVAWINDDGQTYYDALYAALYPPADVLSISAVFTQGEAIIYDTDSLDTLKQYLAVTAIMSDSTTRTVTNYTLSGTLSEGTSTITVLYGGKSTTFTCVVSVATPETIVDTISKRKNTSYKTTQYMPGVLCLGYDDTAKTSTFSGKTITEMQFPTTHANAVVSVGVYDLRTNSAPTTTGMNQYTLDADAKIVFDTPISVGANETLTIGNSATDSLGLPFSTNEKELNPMWIPNDAAGARTPSLLFCAKIVGY